MNSLNGLKICCDNCNGKGYIPKQGTNQYPDCPICKGKGLIDPPEDIEKNNKKLRQQRKDYREFFQPTYKK